MGNRKYILDINNNIYKETLASNRHYLIISPWDRTKDRRVDIFKINKMINNGEAKFISKQKACELLNTMFQNYEERFEVNGQLYAVLNCKNPKSSPLDNFEIIKKHTYKSSCWQRDFSIIYYHGHLYWFVVGCSYYPRVQIARFHGFNVSPFDLCFNQWIHLKDAKIVYKVNDNINYESI